MTEDPMTITTEKVNFLKCPCGETLQFVDGDEVIVCTRKLKHCMRYFEKRNGIIGEIGRICTYRTKKCTMETISGRIYGRYIPSDKVIFVQDRPICKGCAEYLIEEKENNIRNFLNEINGERSDINMLNKRLGEDKKLTNFEYIEGLVKDPCVDCKAKCNKYDKYDCNECSATVTIGDFALDNQFRKYHKRYIKIIIDVIA